MESALDAFIEKYYANLLADWHTKILLKIKWLFLLHIVTTYFHPNCTRSERSRAPATQQSRGKRRCLHTLRRPSQVCSRGTWRVVWAHSHPRSNPIWAQPCACGTAVFAAHGRERQLRGQAPESDGLGREKHSCTIYFLAKVWQGKSPNLLRCRILYLKMGRRSIKLKLLLNEHLVLGLIVAGD